MKQIKVTVLNWGKYQNPRNDTKDHWWHRLNTDFLMNQKVAGFDSDSVFIYLAVLGLSTESRSETIQISPDFLAARTGNRVKKTRVLQCLKQLDGVVISLEIGEKEKKTRNNSVTGLEPECSTTVQYSTKQYSTVQNKILDPSKSNKQKKISSRASAACAAPPSTDLSFSKSIRPTNEFIQTYWQAYRKRFNCDPVIGGKGAGIAQRIVLALGSEKAKLAAQVYVQMDDPWFQTKSYDLATLEQNLNKVSKALQLGGTEKQQDDAKLLAELKEIEHGSTQVQRANQKTEADIRRQSLPAGADKADL